VTSLETTLSRSRTPLEKINVKKTYQFKTQCKDDMMISDI